MLMSVSGRSILAIASTFIIEVNSQLKSDPNDETTALLRVLIYKNTTLSPPSPLHSPCPSDLVCESGSFAVLSLPGDVRQAMVEPLQFNRRVKAGVECSQSRQGKPDGIVAWYFNNVMDSLSLMLQVALILFCCALSRYLWEIDITIPLVVLGVASFGVLCYLFIVNTGTVSESCPYQTPYSHILRYHIHLRLLPALHLTL